MTGHVTDTFVSPVFDALADKVSRGSYASRQSFELAVKTCQAPLLLRQGSLPVKSSVLECTQLIQEHVIAKGCIRVSFHLTCCFLPKTQPERFVITQSYEQAARPPISLDFDKAYQALRACVQACRNDLKLHRSDPDQDLPKRVRLVIQEIGEAQRLLGRVRKAGIQHWENPEAFEEVGQVRTGRFVGFAPPPLKIDSFSLC